LPLPFCKTLPVTLCLLRCLFLVPVALPVTLRYCHFVPCHFVPCHLAALPPCHCRSTAAPLPLPSCNSAIPLPLPAPLPSCHFAILSPLPPRHCPAAPGTRAPASATRTPRGRARCRRRTRAGGRRRSGRSGQCLLFFLFCLFVCLFVCFFFFFFPPWGRHMLWDTGSAFWGGTLVMRWGDGTLSWHDSDTARFTALLRKAGILPHGHCRLV
jgi:hypothetical protein